MLRTMRTSCSSGRVNDVTERSGDQYGTAKRQHNQRERERIVSLRLQPHAEPRLRDVHFPIRDGNFADANDLGREESVSDCRRELIDPIGSAPTGANQLVVGQVLLSQIRRSPAGTNHPVVLIENHDRGVGDCSVSFDDLAELRQIQGPIATPATTPSGASQGVAMKTIGTD